MPLMSSLKVVAQSPRLHYCMERAGDRKVVNEPAESGVRGLGSVSVEGARNVAGPARAIARDVSGLSVQAHAWSGDSVPDAGTGESLCGSVGLQRHGHDALHVFSVGALFLEDVGVEVEVFDQFCQSPEAHFD